MTKETIQLTSKNIRYLIAIHGLGGKDRFIKCTDIARNLSVTRPSVHAMVNTLSELQLIEKPRYGKVIFTQYGAQLSEYYVKCFNTVQKSFSCVLPQDMDTESVVCAFISRIPYEKLDDVCRNIEEKNLFR